MDKELIIRNAETLESAARESLHEANAQAFKFSDLLIKIAFAIGGLAATRIVSDGGVHDLLYSKWGLIFFGMSVVFGGVQMMIDRTYFRKHGFLLTKATDVWKWFSVNHEDPEAISDAKEILNELSDLSKTSVEATTYLQITFVILGVIFALIDVFLV
ncbi:hypothetical protein HYV70_05295 [Candidatus Uhrbacteria bacterium]|nr:hypothetical protein [Candidatus Uhrbacteria bacterium]